MSQINPMQPKKKNGEDFKQRKIIQYELIISKQKLRTANVYDERNETVNHIISECSQLVELGVPADLRVKVKEVKNRINTWGRKTKDLWTMNVTVMLIVVGSLGTTLKNPGKILKYINIPRKMTEREEGEIRGFETIQTTVLLKSVIRENIIKWIIMTENTASTVLYSRNTNTSGNIIKYNLRTSMNERTHFSVKIYLILYSRKGWCFFFPTVAPPCKLVRDASVRLRVPRSTMILCTRSKSDRVGLITWFLSGYTPVVLKCPDRALLFTNLNVTAC